jgi:UPF0755 protein
MILAWLLLLGVAVTAYDLLLRYPNEPAPGEGRLREVTVPEGIGPKGLAARLEKAGLISSPGRFALWLRLTGGLVGVKAGEFHLTDNLTPREIVSVLEGASNSKGERVLIPEGFTLGDIAGALADAGIVDRARFIAAATDSELLKTLEVPGPTFEGYLFPDTYYFEPGSQPEAVIQIMLGRFREKLAAMGIPKGADLKRITTLASIVQAETGLPSEMATVAGVYVNRLFGPHYPSRLLQADPTVAYGCEPYVTPRAPSCASFKGRLTRAQLNDPKNPYNTYELKGLPPGPICAPGEAALRAAFKPRRVPYLFFVAKPNGKGHTFSETLEAHRRAADAYWKK